MVDVVPSVSYKVRANPFLRQVGKVSCPIKTGLVSAAAWRGEFTSFSTLHVVEGYSVRDKYNNRVVVPL